MCLKTPWFKNPRVEFPEYPERAVEEAIANALIHRDYTNYGSEVHIDMYDDRLEVVSPGGMFDGGTPIQDRGNIRDIGSSRRNPLVADIFSRLDFAERRGSGLGKIMDAYSLPLGNIEGRSPSFVSDMFFRAILPNMTYGLAKESLVAFAERKATPNSQTPNSRNLKLAVQVDRTSRPYKSAIQVGHTSRAIDIATAENRVGLVLSLLANGELSLRELMHAVGLRNRPSFYSLYILPAFEMGCVEYTIPDKPKSRLQKYRLTDKGRAMLTRAS